MLILQWKEGKGERKGEGGREGGREGMKEERRKERGKEGERGDRKFEPSELGEEHGILLGSCRTRPVLDSWTV